MNLKPAQSWKLLSENSLMVHWCGRCNGWFYTSVCVGNIVEKKSPWGQNDQLLLLSLLFSTSWTALRETNSCDHIISRSPSLIEKEGEEWAERQVFSSFQRMQWRSRHCDLVLCCRAVAQLLTSVISSLACCSLSGLLAHSSLASASLFFCRVFWASCHRCHARIRWSKQPW